MEVTQNVAVVLMRNGEYCRNKTAYMEFRKQIGARHIEPKAQVEELNRFAAFELWLRRPRTCQEPALRQAMEDMQALDATTAHPLVLHLMDQHEQGRLHLNDLLGCLRDLQSFIIRRSVCGESTRSYGRVFPAAIKAIQPHLGSGLQEFLSSEGWPDDVAFAAKLVEFPIYSREPNKCRLLLEHLERQAGHKEPVDMTRTNVEHIMPQTLGDDCGDGKWRQMLGPHWDEIHPKWVHTLGNLTLTGYNPELSNKSFGFKRSLFEDSNLQLNRYFSLVDRWDVEAIQTRGSCLAERVVTIWPRPGSVVYVPGSNTEDSESTPDQPKARAGRSRLRIVVRWSRWGKAAPDEEFCDPTACGTVVRFVEKLALLFGEEMTGRLGTNPILRKMLSRNPSVDFVNGKTGRTYPRVSIRGTDLYLCTHSSTDEKRDELNRLVHFLGLAPEGVDILIVKPGAELLRLLEFD